MSSDNTLLVVSVIAVVVAAFALIFTALNLSVLSVMLAPTDTGDVDVNIVGEAAIQFTVDTINWGDGTIPFGSPTERLSSYRGSDPPFPDNSGGTLSTPGGFWDRTDPEADGIGGGFLIENVGNVDVVLDVRSGKTAAQFLGQPGVPFNDPQGNLQIFLSNNVSSSCTAPNQVVMTTGDPWVDWVNVTTSDETVCNVFAHAPGVGGPNGILEMDVVIYIPSTTPSGAKTNTFTATAVSV